MPTLIQEDEDLPASYPPTPSGLSTAAAALDPDVIWQRIESYIARRWTARSVEWVIDGGGWWMPPLSPATVSATEIWQDYAWASVTLNPTPTGGFVLQDDEPYRITASVGAGTVPAAVDQAFIRLAEYMADSSAGPAGSSSASHDVGSVSISHDRSATWLARAIQNSGAADLLRPYRKV